MKQVLFLLLLIPALAFAQADTTTDYKFTVIDSIKESQASLFLKAKSWLATTFVSSKAVIEMEDKDAGKIIGKGVFQFDQVGGYVFHMNIKFTITINVKDNKYRMILSDFINEGYDSKNGHKINGFGMSFTDSTFQTFPYAKNTVIPETTKRSLDLLENFKKAMKKPSTDNF